MMKIITEKILVLRLPILLAFFILLSNAEAQNNRQLIQEDSKNAEKRLALVIGNGAYADSPLRNPANDAIDMAAALKTLGFEVTLLTDSNQTAMKRAIRTFGEKLRENDGVGLFYFAGHGVQVKGINYLIPVGATVNTEEEVEYEGIDVGLVMAQMDSAKNKLNIVILDACRNNPFARSYRSSDKGLASIDAPSGTLLALSTAPGSVAADGSGRNGIYTQELLKQMKISGLSIEDVFKRVRLSVRGLTQDKQTPWESSSLTGNFYFLGNADKNTLIVTKSAAEVEQEFWDSVKNSADAEDFRSYLKNYPNGAYSAIASNNLRRLEKPVTNPSTTSTPNQTTPTSANNTMSETERKVKEITDKNTGITNSNTIYQRFLDAGNAAFNAKNYDEAIENYNQALMADPTHPGAMMLWRNKSIAFRTRGVGNYNSGRQSKNNDLMNKGKADLREAANASERSAQLFKAQILPGDTSALITYNKNKLAIYENYVECLRLALQVVDVSYADRLLTAYSDYALMEADTVRLTVVQKNVGSALYQAGEFDKALPIFRRILAADPTNIDGLYGAGMTLFSIGTISDNKNQIREAVPFLQKFIDLAPQADVRRAETQEILKFIKTNP